MICTYSDNVQLPSIFTLYLQGQLKGWGNSFSDSNDYY